eukprot:jgi/Galph1/4606/GphlegSOOS_G3242.1
MSIRTYKAYTPGTRNKTVSDFKEISNNKPCKKLIVSTNRKYGRNNQGKITSRHKQRGHKKQYRLIDFARKKKDIISVVSSIEYDPNRNARIALLHYKDGTKSYVLCPNNLKIGAEIVSSIEHNIIQIGNSLPLYKIPLGIVVHNVELIPGKGGQIARAGGTYAQIIAKDDKFVTLKLPSGEVRLIRKECMATIGQVSNVESSLIKIGKAGRNRWFGNRPRVRGVAMNPVDHPHGGGEGKSPIGRKYPVTPWGKPALGAKTRRSSSNLESLRNEIYKILAPSEKIRISVIEVIQADADAVLVSEFIVQQLEKRIAFRRVIRQAVNKAQRTNIKGIKIQVSGRLNGSEIARTEWIREGRVPLQTLRANIDYAYKEAQTTYGIIGVKVWIFKNEIL